MTERSNIDVFNDHVSQVFALLYESFPTPRDIDFQSFTYEDLPEENREMGTVPESMYEPAMHAVGWLIKEDYIRCETSSIDGGFYLVQLTGKGLATLQSVPASLQGTTSIGQRISEAVKSGSKEVARKMVTEAISWGFKQLSS